MQKPPMRERFSALINDEDKFSIGFEQRTLIKVLKHIDTIHEYMLSNRNFKFVFFEDLRKNLEDSARAYTTTEKLQQLLFLDKQLYEVEWKMNERIKRYDLMLRKEDRIASEDERLKELRKKIVSFLLDREAEFMAANNLVKAKRFGWVEGFDPNKYFIPKLVLPTHPL